MICWNLSPGDEKSVLISDGLDIVWSQPSPHNSSSSLTFRKWSLSHWTYSLMDLIKPLLNCYPFMFHCLCKLRKTLIEILAKIIWENIILFIAFGLNSENLYYYIYCLWQTSLEIKNIFNFIFVIISISPLAVMCL